MLSAHPADVLGRPVAQPESRDTRESPWSSPSLLTSVCAGGVTKRTRFAELRHPLAQSALGRSISSVVSGRIGARITFECGEITQRIAKVLSLFLQDDLEAPPDDILLIGVGPGWLANAHTR